MSPTYPAVSSTATAFPSFSLKSPLGRGFPVKSAHKTQLPTKNGKTPVSNHTGNRSRVEDEYIRNLQQQVYLLELETRYLRTQPRDGNNTPGNQGLVSSLQDHNVGGAAPLNDAIKGLKAKYIELQENHKRELKKFEDQIEKMKMNEQILNLNLQTNQTECNELKSELKSLKDHHTNEKDKLYGELLAHRKKSEIATSEHARLQKTQQRLSLEKQQQQSTMQHALDDAKKYRDQVEELLHINATLKSKLDDHNANILGEELESEKSRLNDLRKDNEVLMIEIQQALTKAKQEEQMKLRIAQDCEELVKSNVTLKNELEEVQRRLRREFESREQKIQKRQDSIRESEEIKEEFNRIKDEYSMLKISVDNKDRRLQDFRMQINSMENALNNALETRNILEERCEELEARTLAQETELIQMGQDKSLLIDDVAELRNTTDIKASKLQHLIRENQDMKIQIEKFKREAFARQEFQHLISEIEAKGENYLHLKYEKLFA
ncbi:hypothetical protein HK100_005920 [Physocladia obscura]|uniref:Uncharacterized protein n=1 Tax=Physocladia obscura TaxID=109957 RepID=A0AAD5T889_9FUNG|nr:hypothetical protein HK100_005920 [Physocladia obscura]